ncbi:inosine/xanthosine triphosphatase [Paraferrimonas sedimenticola]|uniref:Inosine/xanthosine triphosphatase n=1 Tax=Paraferrimonas sedimenticola TaxID=375674 RepID=A0AA37VYY9_9GAMM|nr:inosine/xanthosine triphosphatase [Paraferrimonas sedimenticola]GLP97271.1 non-canonical purine NTP phosphatase [Paraferrimonas sedimenticola]
MSQQPILTIRVASLNPVKIAAAEQAFRQLFPDSVLHCQGLATESGVSDQPMDQAETRQGALNRIEALQQAAPGVDYTVAMEGGVDVLDGQACTFAYIAVAKGERVSCTRTSALPLPQVAFDALTQGEELGDVMDKLFNDHNIKQKGGAIGVLTQGQTSRQSVYQQALLMAMAPFINPELY